MLYILRSLKKTYGNMAIVRIIVFSFIVPVVISNMERVIFSCTFEDNLCDFNVITLQNARWHTDNRGFAFVDKINTLIPDAGNAVMATPLLEAKRLKISFNYALYGEDVIYLQTDYRIGGKVFLLHWSPVQRSDEWNEFVGEFNASSPFSVRFSAVKRNGGDYFMAIDNVTLIELLDPDVTHTDGMVNVGLPTTSPSTSPTQAGNVPTSTFVEGNQSSTVTIVSSGRERTLVQTNGISKLNTSDQRLALIWLYVAIGFVSITVACLLLVFIFVRSTINGKRTSVKSGEISRGLQSENHLYENIDNTLYITDQMTSCWKRFFKCPDAVSSGEQHIVHKEETALSYKRNDSTSSNTEIRSLSQDPISANWTQNLNYAHSSGVPQCDIRNNDFFLNNSLEATKQNEDSKDYLEEEPHYYVLPCNNDTSISSANSEHKDERSTTTKHTYAMVQKRPSNTVWEENPIYEAGDVDELA
ncbi:uncharacterized protein [Antedon mediterranea]|uniref:uncharacterized protein n=1 Tax=Antedon mediterranea TaxID=105859 RepID=UPI003AF45AF0